jgi:hypothetical protein
MATFVKLFCPSVAARSMELAGLGAIRRDLRRLCSAKTRTFGEAIFQKDFRSVMPKASGHPDGSGEGR